MNHSLLQCLLVVVERYSSCHVHCFRSVSPSPPPSRQPSAPARVKNVHPYKAPGHILRFFSLASEHHSCVTFKTLLEISLFRYLYCAYKHTRSGRNITKITPPNPDHHEQHSIIMSDSGCMNQPNPSTLVKCSASTPPL